MNFITRKKFILAGHAYSAPSWFGFRVKRLAEWRDWTIYRLAVPAINRYLGRSAGMCYLHYLSAKAATECNPPSPELRESTELFFESMNEHVQNTAINPPPTRPNPSSGTKSL